MVSGERKSSGMTYTHDHGVTSGRFTIQCKNASRATNLCSDALENPENTLDASYVNPPLYSGKSIQWQCTAKNNNKCHCCVL